MKKLFLLASVAFFITGSSFAYADGGKKCAKCSKGNSSCKKMAKGKTCSKDKTAKM